MESLLKACQSCRKPMNGGVYKAAHICPHCLFEHAGGKSKKRKPQAVARAAEPQAQVSEQSRQAPQSSPQKPRPVETAQQPGLAEVEEISLEDVVEPVAAAPAKPAPSAKPATVVLTAKTAEGYPVLESRGDISAECTLNLKLTPDLISNGKFVGTKSEKVKAALMQGQKNVLAQLRQKALDQGINLVTEVAVKNAVKAADGQNVSIIVKVTGKAATAELAPEAVEA
jgi:uncharacterized protein YbjQ (UPF0145 family)